MATMNEDKIMKARERVNHNKYKTNVKTFEEIED